MAAKFRGLGYTTTELIQESRLPSELVVPQELRVGQLSVASRHELTGRCVSSRLALRYRWSTRVIMLNESCVRRLLSKSGLVWCSFMGAVNRPEPVVCITLAAIPVNCLAGLSADLCQARPATAGALRGGSCDRSGELCDVAGLRGATMRSPFP